MTRTLITLPGLIDCHVHFREPGMEHKGTMATESAAAYAGGVRTVCEMPNTNPPTVSIEAFQDKVRRAEKIHDVDIRFFFGATEAGHIQEFRKAWSMPELRKRLVGMKIFFDHSTGDQGAAYDVIEGAFKLCASLGAPLVAHCEDAAINAEARELMLDQVSEATDVSLHSLMRPCASEARAIEQALSLTRTYGTQFHIAHLSTALGIELVRDAKKEGLPVTCEVTPHHLFLTIDDYETLSARGKMNPPLRTAQEQKALWQGIADGTVDCIGTDHAPHLLQEKESGNPLAAPSGVPGTETMLPLLLTVVAGGWPHPNGKSQTGNAKISMDDLRRLCFTNPNRIFNLNAPEEEVLQIDTTAEWEIHGEELHSKCGWTPYEGWRVRGLLRESQQCKHTA
ncbi:MAG: dihydroorotase family protein [Candidatus Peribacteraceae bacterium]